MLIDHLVIIFIEFSEHLVEHLIWYHRFLTEYFLDKFSSKTKDIEGDPFTELGTSHTMAKHQFSGLIQRYHPSFINDNQGEEGLPICLIMPTNKKHFLYLQKAQWFRAGDVQTSPDDLWKKAVGEMPELIKEQAQSMIKLYNIKDMAHFSWINQKKVSTLVLVF